MLGTFRSAAVFGIDALVVHVEVDVSHGLPCFTLVGLPDTSVRESRDRVRAAIQNSGYEFPLSRVTINLAPADLRKVGAAFDLPIAVGVIAAGGAIARWHVDDWLLLVSCHWMAPSSPPGACSRSRWRPGATASRPSCSRGRTPPRLPSSPTCEWYRSPRSPRPWPPSRTRTPRRALPPRPTPTAVRPGGAGDFVDIRDQALARRALEISAAGAHNLLMVGPPGAGKTMAAQRLPGILPAMRQEEALEASSIHSVAGLLPPGHGLLRVRPFRSPHHSISEMGLVGGGTLPRPGEISLAHHGVLFLDEVPEFGRRILELLRQPLEEGRIAIARLARTAVFPTRFVLVGAMNPCPCGYHGDATHTCRCTPLQVDRYRNRLSGPLRDRIDLTVEVAAVPTRALRKTRPENRRRRFGRAWSPLATASACGWPRSGCVSTPT